MAHQDERPGIPKRPLILLLLLCVVASAALALVALERAKRSSPVAIVEGQSGPFRGNVLPEGIDRSPAADFRLTEARGGEVDTRELAGRPYALTFLYTRCPDVCPIIGQEIRQALELLGPRAGDVAAVAISVDPRHDTPEAVRAWLERQGLPANFHYAVGEESELKPVWDAYYAAPQIPGRAESSHSASIWLVDGEGRIRTKFSAGAPVEPADLAHDFEFLLDEAERRQANRHTNLRSG